MKILLSAILLIGWTCPAQQVSSGRTAHSGPITISAVAGGCGNGFAHCYSITVAHGMIGGSNLTAGTYVVYIAGIVAMGTVPNGGYAQNGSLFDVEFTSDITCGTKLNWQTVVPSVTGTGSEYHFLPTVTLSASTDTIAGYLCIGNAAITTDQSNRTGTWPPAYAMVQHHQNGTTISLLDATSNANNGTNHGATATSLVIDGAANFVQASSQYVNYGNGSSLEPTAAVSAEAWFKYTGTQVGGQFPGILSTVDRSLGSPSGYEILISQNAGAAANCIYTQLINAGTTVASGNVPGLCVMVVVGTTYHVASVYDGSTLKFYVNGVLNDSETATGGLGANTSPLLVGSLNGFSGGYFDGPVDEVRIVNGALSAGVIAADVINQGTPTAFYTLTQIH